MKQRESDNERVKVNSPSDESTRKDSVKEAGSVSGLRELGTVVVQISYQNLARDKAV